MKSIFRLMLASREVSTAITINKLISFLQKLPFVGSKVPDRLYGSRDLKTALVIIGSLIRFSRRLMLKSLYIGVLVVIGSMAAQEVGGVESASFVLEAAMTIFFFLSFVSAPLAFGKSINLDIGTDLLMIDKLRADAALYVPARIYERKIIDLGMSLPFALLLAFTESYSLLQSLAILPLLLAVKLICEALLLANFACIHKISRSAYKLVSYFYVALGLLAFITPYILVALGIFFPFKAVVFSPWFIAAVLLLVIPSIIYIRNYQLYRELAWGTVVNYNLALEKAKPAQKKQLFGDVDKWAGKEDDQEIINHSFSHLSGYKLFNKLFFFRHRKFFNRKILLRTAIMAAANILAVVVMLLDKSYESESTSRVLPICFFFAYMLSIGRTATGAMFVNCDAAMLTYPFYRTPEVVIRNFYHRLGRILLMNLPAFLLLGLMTVNVDLLAPLYAASGQSVSWTEIPLYLLTIAMMWLFFSFHDLFIYYILQPYNSELGTTNKLFMVIRFAVYMLSYANVFLTDINIALYMSIIAAATIAYILIGLACINRYCIYTFKLR